MSPRSPNFAFTAVLRLLPALLFAVACTRAKAPSQATEQPVIAQVPSAHSASADTLSVLVDSLTRLEGEFVATQVGTYEFSGDRSVLLAFTTYGDSAVAKLVDCIDRPDLAAARFRGSPVRVGFMCLTALEHTIYSTKHEDADDPEWPGLVEPGADPAALRAAKKAWQEVVATKAYRFAVDRTRLHRQLG
jgi:hypothetical protein